MKRIGKKISLALMMLLLSTSLLVSATEQQETINAKDGIYKVEVDMSGGSGRASITSPTQIQITDGLGTATIEWSSPNYDYMIVNDEKYLPEIKDGKSTFEIPVLVWDKEMKVIADTTAMSTPHEIEYTLVFHSESLHSKNTMQSILMQVAVVAVAALCAKYYLSNKKRKVS